MGGPVNQNTAIPSSDYISVGWAISDHNHSNTALPLSLTNADAYIGFSCNPGSPAAQYTLTIALSSSALSYPQSYAANGGWYASNTATDPETYQAASFVFGSLDQCNGAAYVVDNGVQYAGTLASTSHTSDLFHIQFHTAITQKGCGGADAGAGSPQCNFPWNWDVDNISASYQPPATPTPISSPAPALSAGGGSISPPKSQVKAAATHAPRSSRTPGPVSRGSAAGGAHQTPAVMSGPPPASGWARSGLAPLPVVTPLVSNAADSLFEHVPIPMLSILAAIDVVLALLLIERRRRLRDRPTYD